MSLFCSICVSPAVARRTDMNIVFNYDPWRGGFYLELSGKCRDYERPAFGSLMLIHFDNHDQIVAIESDFRDHGGVPLRGIHETSNFPEGSFLIKGRELRVDSFQIRQSAVKIEIWFSTGNKLPRHHWTKQHDTNSGVTAWFSSRKAKAGWPVPGVGGRAEIPMLAGLMVEFHRTAAAFPISSVLMSVEDFKG